MSIENERKVVKILKSVKEIYKIGKGPSSSHTMGPQKASEIFKNKYKNADLIRVSLYGSLCKTGKGHGTDKVIKETLSPIKSEINFISEVDFDLPHPNTMDFYAYKDGTLLGNMRILSIGGGDIVTDGKDSIESEEIYPHKNLSEIISFCKVNKLRLYEYAKKFEGKNFYNYLSKVFKVMNEAIERGISADGKLPGGLNVERKAKKLYNSALKKENISDETRLVSAYAFAVSEENADNGTIVTAPTCGSCGVLPSVLRYMQETGGYSENEMLNALATAGIIGNVVRTNASISGAECGCQAEVGTACSMAAAAIAELKGLSLDKIDYASEIAMEHHIGLTCDPVHGLVQIPCIERNAMAALRAISSAEIADVLGHTNKVLFDTIVKTMYETGKDISNMYKETSEGGLAKMFDYDKNTELRFAKQDEYSELLDFLDRVFGFVKSEDRFISILPKLYKKEYNPCSHNVVIRDSEKILGAVGLYPFIYDIGNESIKGAVIGNVGVDKDSRSKGYMGKMMKYAINQSDSSGNDFIVLGGLRQRYERYGFSRLGYKTEFTFVKENVKHCLEDKNLAEVEFVEVKENDKELLDKMFELYSAKNIKVKRFRSNFYDTAVSWSSKIYAVMSNGFFVGYFLENKDAIHETVLKSENYFYSVIKHYLVKKPKVTVKIPPCDRELLKLAFDVSEYIAVETQEMYRIRNLAKVAGAFFKVGCKEGNYADGSLVLSVHHSDWDEKFELEVKNGEPFVRTKVEEKVPTLELSEKEASSLLFSYYSFGSIREKLSPGVRTWFPLPLYLNLADHG